MIHQTQSALANTTVKIKTSVYHPNIQNFGGSNILIIDWYDRVFDHSWNTYSDGKIERVAYSLRATNGDDEVLYGSIGTLHHLVHVSEIEETL